MRNKSTKPVHCFFGCFSETPPAVPGRTKGLSLSVSSEAGGMVFNTKRCSTQWAEPRLREAGQAMQEAEHSVPLERLAGNMPFRGLRRPPAVPEVWLPAQCAQGRYLQWLSPLRIFGQRKIKRCFFCFYGMRQPAAGKSRGAFFRPAVSLCLCPAGFAAFPAVPEKPPGTAKAFLHRPFCR